MGLRFFGMTRRLAQRVGAIRQQNMVVAAFRKSLLSISGCGRVLKRNGGTVNKEVTANKMGTDAVPKVMLGMGIPIILSMVLQACYNIVDSMFVARIPEDRKSVV